MNYSNLNMSLSNDIPEEIWLKHLIESYRRQGYWLDQLETYAKNLEEHYHLISGKCSNLEYEGRKLSEENDELKKKLAELETISKGVKKADIDRIALLKSIIKSQFYHISYLHTVLHLNRVTYNKKGSYTMVHTKQVKSLIQECLSAKSVNE